MVFIFKILFIEIASFVYNMMGVFLRIWNYFSKQNEEENINQFWESCSYEEKIKAVDFCKNLRLFKSWLTKNGIRAEMPSCYEFYSNTFMPFVNKTRKIKYERTKK